MPLIELTLQDTPARPVTIATEQIATLKPLRMVLPSANSHTPGATHIQERGTEIVMANGTKHNVLEHYVEVLDRVKSYSVGRTAANPIPQSTVAELNAAMSQKADLPTKDETQEQSLTSGTPDPAVQDPAAGQAEQTGPAAVSGEPWIPEEESEQEIKADIREAVAKDVEEAKKSPAKKAPAKKAAPKNDQQQGDENA